MVEGVLLTMYDGRTNLSNQVAEVRRRYKDKVYHADTGMFGSVRRQVTASPFSYTIRTVQAVAYKRQRDIGGERRGRMTAKQRKKPVWAGVGGVADNGRSPQLPMQQISYWKLISVPISPGRVQRLRGGWRLHPGTRCAAALL